MIYNKSEEELHAYERKFHKKHAVFMPKTISEKEEIADFIAKSLSRTKMLSDIIRTSTDEREFFLSLNEMNRILYDLTPYENMFEFPELPSTILRTVYENRVKYIERLYERIESAREKDFDSMDGHQFENYCAEILNKNDFKNVEVTQGSGDHGIDVLAEKDNISYAIQCKCYSSNIGNAAVQQAHTGKSIYRKDIAVVLTNRYFTTQAKEEAQVLGVKLWDRDKLKEMIKNG